MIKKAATTTIVAILILFWIFAYPKITWDSNNPQEKLFIFLFILVQIVSVVGIIIIHRKIDN